MVLLIQRNREDGRSVLYPDRIAGGRKSSITGRRTARPTNASLLPRQFDTHPLHPQHPSSVKGEGELRHRPPNPDLARCSGSTTVASIGDRFQQRAKIVPSSKQPLLELEVAPPEATWAVMPPALPLSSCHCRCCVCVRKAVWFCFMQGITFGRPRPFKNRLVPPHHPPSPPPRPPGPCVEAGARKQD